MAKELLLHAHAEWFYVEFETVLPGFKKHPEPQSSYAVDAGNIGVREFVGVPQAGHLERLEDDRDALAVLRTMSRRAAAGRAELLANGAVNMEHGLEIENVGRRGPLSTAVTWPLADGPSVCF